MENEVPPIGEASSAEGHQAPDEEQHAEPPSTQAPAEPTPQKSAKPVHVIVITKRKVESFGFNIKGGSDKPIVDGDPAIYVTRIRPGAAAEREGSLKRGDKIVEINGVDVRNTTHGAVLDLVRNSKGGRITLHVEKNAIHLEDPEEKMTDELGQLRIELHKQPGRALGFNIRGGIESPFVPGDASIYVTRIGADGIAAHDGRLSVGDRILEINGIDILSISAEEAVNMINASKKRIVLFVQKRALQTIIQSAREGAVDTVRGQEMMVRLDKDEVEGLGITVRGGSDANYLRDHPGIFITAIKPGSVADRSNRLKAGDRIIEINGASVRNVTQNTAVEMIMNAGTKVALLVEKNAEDLYKKSELYNLNYDEVDMSGERGCFFRDGKRRIDYVLAYEEKEDELPTREVIIKRRKFMDNLHKQQLEFEEEISQTPDGKLHFLKCHIPWDVMLFYAEELHFRGPLQAREGQKINWSERWMKKLHLPNVCKDDVPDTPPDYFTGEFKANKFHKFIGSDNKDTYFTATERTRVAYEILETAAYGKKAKGEIGISRLVEEGIYSAAYPLHDGPEDLPPEWKSGPDGPDEIKLNMRQILREYWGRWGKWTKYQPLDHIRWYYGEKIGIYFAWLGQYTAWLWPPSILGLLVFIYGYLSLDGEQNLPALDVCNFPNWTFTMCPLCDERLGCKVWDLKTSCGRGRIAYLFDNPMTVAYAVFVSFWAVLFLEYWKRKEATLGYHWDVMDFESGEERPRPTFAALAPAVERNPVTGMLEPHFPQERRFPRVVAGVAVVFTMISLVVLFMVGVIIYKLLIMYPLYENPDLQPYAAGVASGTGAMFNLIIIMILSKVYEKIALVLNHWEMYRTQTEYEDNLTFKVFVFQFMNFYSSIFYIAFFKGKLIGRPGDYTKFLGLRSEQCSPGGCLMELAQQLAVIMIGKQVIGNVKEVLIPELKQYLKRRKRGSTEKEVMSRWEMDYDLLENEGLFDEYLEMIIQYGFITIFVAAFPLAPFFALANNVFEIRIDADKLVCDLRRPVAHRAQDIGIWFSILETITKIAVISNAFLIGFTSTFLPKLLYQGFVSENHTLEGYTNFSLAWAPPNTTSQPCRYIDFRDSDGDLSKFYWHLLTLRLAFVILFEHIVFGVSALIGMLVPDVPHELEEIMKREKYLAQQALADHHHLMGSKEDALDDVSVSIG